MRVLMLILIIALIGCKSPRRSLVGKWNGSYSISEYAGLYIVEYLISGHQFFIPTGTELTIASDSTFRYNTCAIETGKWKVKNDSLFLKFDSVRYSIAGYRKEVLPRTYTRVYKIEDKRLIRRWQGPLISRISDGSIKTNNNVSFVEILR